MQLVFANLRKNIPECWHSKSLPVHKRYVSKPNMTVMGTNSSAKATDIGWRSKPNLKFHAGHQRYTKTEIIGTSWFQVFARRRAVCIHAEYPRGCKFSWRFSRVAGFKRSKSFVLAPDEEIRQAAYILLYTSPPVHQDESPEPPVLAKSVGLCQTFEL